MSIGKKLIAGAVALVWAGYAAGATSIAFNLAFSDSPKPANDEPTRPSKNKPEKGE